MPAIALIICTVHSLLFVFAIDYDSFRFFDDSSNSIEWNHFSGELLNTGKNYSAFIARFSPKLLSFYPPERKGCERLDIVRNSSKRFDCDCH